MAKLHRDNAGYIGCSHEETQDPYYSYNKLSLPLSGATETVQRPAEVTHTVTASGGKFYIDGFAQASLTLIEGGIYKFDQSDSSNSSHPFKFSQTADGTWNRGTEYTKGVSYVGTRGTSGAYTQLVVPFGGLNLFYYCQQHAAMGGSASTPANAEMFTAALPILKTTDQFGATLGSGVADDPFAANLVLAVPMNGSNNGTTFTDQSAAIKGSGSAKAITRTNAVTSTAKSNYYGSSGYYNANSSRLGVANSSDFDFGSGDYTIEIWVYPADSGTRNIVSRSLSGGPGNYSGFILSTAGFLETTSQSSWDVNISHTLPLNTWSHCAVTRNGSLWTYFVNGVSVGTAIAHGSVPTGPGDLYVSYRSGQYDFNGYLSDLRIYKGIAKYQPEESGDLGFQALSYLGIGVKQSIGDPVYSDHITATGSGAVTGLHSTQYSARGLFDGDSNTYFASAAGNVSSNPAILTITFPPGYRPPYSNNVVLEAYAGTTDTVRVAINGGAWQTVSGSNNWAQHTVASGSGEISEIKVSRQKANTNNGAAELRKILIDGDELRDSGGAAPLLFKPDFVWLKNDGSTTGHHCLYDSVRGVYKHLQTSSTALEYTENTGRGLSAFNSDGFTLDTSNGEHVGEGNINVSGQRYSAYAWKAGGAAATIAAGSSNSSAYDQSQTWSSLITPYLNSPLGAGDGTQIFDGSTSTQTTSNNTSGAGIKFTPTSNISGIIELWLRNGDTSNSTFSYSVDGGSNFTNVTTVGGSGSYVNIGQQTITTTNGLIVRHITTAGTNAVSWRRMRVSGKELIDSGVSVANVPSIASSVSASTDYGFSIVKYSPASSTETLAHSLGTEPRLILVKRTDNNASWSVFHADAGPGKVAELNGQGKPVASASAWNNTAPTSNVFSIGNYPDTGVIGADYIAYLFADKIGYQKISSYVGNAGSNKVTTGFRPSFLLIKADIDGEDWIIMDDARTPVNPVNDAFFANNGTVPNPHPAYSVDFNDDGFTVNNNNPRFNTNTETYYYMAIAGRKPSDPGQDAFKVLDTLNTKDQSSSAHTVTNNGASFQTSVQKFYGGAADFSNFGKVTVTSDDFAFGTGDYTIEMWVYHTALGAQATYFGDTFSNTAGVYFYKNSANYIGVYYSGQIVTGGTLMPQNSWVHVAAVRHSGTTTVYVNGTPDGSGADTTNLTVPDYGVGETPGGNSGSMEGYIQDVRVYKGIAKYTSSFSPPERSLQGTARRYPSGVYVVS